MKNLKFLSVLLLAGAFMFTGCGGGSDSPGVNNGGDNNDTNQTVSPHPGETEAEAKARYYKDIKDIAKANQDINTSDPKIDGNLIDIAECIYNADPTLNKADITATFGAGFDEEDVNGTISCDDYTVRKVGGTFADSQRVLYYAVNNPVTDNDQLLAYDYDNSKAHVVNTNVILGNKVFLFEGEKDGEKSKFTGKKHGLFLDPNQEFETRIIQGRYGPSTYKFFSNNKLMKFDVKNPTSIESFFSSDQIPSSSSFSGLNKLGGKYKVVENIVDPNNSYIGLKAFESLADEIKGEDPEEKLQADITVRVADKKAVLGRPLAVIKDSEMKTTAVLISEAPAFKPASQTGVYVLKKYDPALSSGLSIGTGEYFFATQNDTHIYFFKEGSNKFYAYTKNGGISLTEVTGIMLAGAYDYNVHAKGSRHGSSTNLIDGGSTLSGRKPHLGSGNDAYISFHYDLQADIGEAFVFGSFGAYKSAQVFKLTGTSGVKIMENGDGVDHSANPTNEANNGHVNLIAVAGGKVYAERGWWDGNTTLGGTCTQKYPHPMAQSTACFHVKYGYLDSNAANPAPDVTKLTFGGNDLEINNLPYYVSRRIGPVAVNGVLYISTFAGGTRTSGYEYKQYQYTLSTGAEIKEVDGRTYFTKTHESNNGDFGGTVIAWTQDTQTIFNTDSGVDLASTADINGKPGFSISSLTSGVPLAGVGTLAMLKNNEGSHKFALFSVDAENGGLKYIDFAPYGGWIYE